MVYNDLDREPGTFKVMTLVLEGFYNHKQFLIMGIIITLCPGEFPGPKRYRMLVFFSAITGIKLVKKWS